MKITIQTMGSPGAYALAETARAMGHEAAVGDFTQNHSRLYANQADIFIPRVSHGSYEDAVALANECAAQNPACVMAVDGWGIEHSFDKYLAHQAFSQAGVATPWTRLIKNPADIEACVPHLPLILKPRTQNQGKGIVVVRDVESLRTAAEHLLREYTTCIAQSFVAEAAGKDIRAFVVGDKVVAAMERTAKPGSDLANLSAGGSAQPAELTSQEAELAVKSAALFNAEYAGVDLLRGASGPVVLEVNVSPGFKIAKVTGVDVVRLIIEHLVHKKENQHD